MGGKAIEGATSDIYKPAYIEGTVYYYCAVRAVNGTEVSSAAKTKCAAITYKTEETEPTAPEETVTEPVTQETVPPARDTLPTEPAKPIQSGSVNRGMNAILIFALIVCLLAIAVIGAAVVLKFYPPDPAKLPLFLRRILFEEEDWDEDDMPEL